MKSRKRLSESRRSEERDLTAADSQTRRSFSDKWGRNPELALEQTLDESSNFQRWILERNGFADADAAARQLRSHRRILDAGCGNGRTTALLARLAPSARVTGIDLVDLAPARRNAAGFANAEFVNADLRKSLRALGRFDFIYCQEVLHHTGDAEASFRNLVEILDNGGTIAIYVYRRKAPAREFMDDHVRALIAELPYEEAMDACRQIAEFGRRLSLATAEIELDDVPILGIEKGSYTPQRVLYNFFAKCYWNDALTAEENAVINYDWYHPQHCSRHTLDEVLRWFDRAALRVSWEHQDLYGITVHGERR